MPPAPSRRSRPAPRAVRRTATHCARRRAAAGAAFRARRSASPRHDRLLAIALGASLLLHVHRAGAALHAAATEHDEVERPPLEVALVNAKTEAKPTKADILAQANLDGGGNTEPDRRAKTPLPVLPKDSPTQRDRRRHAAGRGARAADAGADDAAALERRSPRRSPSPTDAARADRVADRQRADADARSRRCASRRRSPRTWTRTRSGRSGSFVGARAEEYRFARYVEDWRLKIERVGNLNYPEAAREQKLYGSLLLTVSIRADGSVENVEVNRSLRASACSTRRRCKIVEMSAPFAAFPPDIRATPTSCTSRARGRSPRATLDRVRATQQRRGGCRIDRYAVIGNPGRALEVAA